MISSRGFEWIRVEGKRRRKRDVPRELSRSSPWKEKEQQTRDLVLEPQMQPKQEEPMEEAERLREPLG